MIDLRTNGMKKVQIKIDKGDGIDTANVYFAFAKKPMYFNYELFGYLHRKNRVDFNATIA